MTDEGKTREQLVEELVATRQRVVELEAAKGRVDSEEDLTKKALANVPAFVSYVDSELTYRFVNAEYERRFGVPCTDIVGRKVEDLLRSHDKAYFAKARSCFDAVLAGDTVQFEERFRLRGETFWVDTTYVPDRGSDGKVSGFFVFGRDVTGRKRAEEELRSSLREKDVLLREVHHRVKNNLQVIISLLRLQSRQIANEEALRAFANCEERIRAIALLHELLYSSDNLDQVSCREYVGKLIDGLARTQGRAGAASVALDVADVSIRGKPIRWACAWSACWRSSWAARSASIGRAAPRSRSGSSTRMRKVVHRLWLPPGS